MTRSKRLKSKSDLSQASLTIISALDFFQFKIWHIVNSFAWNFETMSLFYYKNWHVVKVWTQNMWHFLFVHSQSLTVLVFLIQNLKRCLNFKSNLTPCDIFASNFDRMKEFVSELVTIVLFEIKIWDTSNFLFKRMTRFSALNSKTLIFREFFQTNSDRSFFPLQILTQYKDFYFKFWQALEILFQNLTPSKSLKWKPDLSQASLTEILSFGFFQLKIWHVM